MRNSLPGKLNLVIAICIALLCKNILFADCGIDWREIIEVLIAENKVSARII